MPTAVVLDAKQKRELVDRVATSAAFQRSPRLREFLLYVADCTLTDRPEDARELKIAQNVFNRKPDYNPGQDNIVRVEARSLRKRLEAYFATDGKDEPVVIVMPRGSYAISLEPRASAIDAAVQIAEPAIASAPAAEQEDTTGPVLPHVRASRVRLPQAIIALLSVVVVAQWFFARAGKPARPPAARILPFAALFDNTLETYIITSDTCLNVIEELTRRTVTLNDYITGRYPEPAPGGSDTEVARTARMLRFRHYTDGLEMAVAGRILQFGNGIAPRIYLRSGHSVQLSDLQNRNVILLGGAISNPWTRLFFDKLNFQNDVADGDQGERIFVRNRSPRPGEQAEYFAPVVAGQSGETYAVVSFLPNVSGPGNALLIGGMTAEATAAATEFILDPGRTSKALKAIGINPAGPTRYFELLLKVMTLPGGATQSSLVTWRLIPTPS